MTSKMLRCTSLGKAPKVDIAVDTIITFVHITRTIYTNLIRLHTTT